VSQSIIEKIRKLQALADRTTSEAEAVNAAARVQELLSKHNLEVGSIELKTEEGTDKAVEKDFSRISLHHFKLAQACDVLFDVKHYLMRFRGNSNSYRRLYGGGAIGMSRMNFVGLMANVEAACMTFLYLSDSVESLVAGYRRGARVAAKKDMGTFVDCRAFRVGASERILEMAGAYKRRSVEMNPAGNEIVHIGNALAEQMISRMKFKKGSGFAPVGRGSAFESGYAEGGRVDIHGARTNRMLNSGE
jgi:hypothetical protein